MRTKGANNTETLVDWKEIRGIYPKGKGEKTIILF